MKTYKVKATTTVYLVAEIEAADENEAWEIGVNGDLFKEIPYSGGWEVTDVEEVSHAQTV